MTIETTDVRSSPREQIMHAVEVIGRSKSRLKVFEEIYRGKRSVKTVDDIASKIHLERKRVLEAGLALYKNRLVKRKKINGRLAFLKDDFYSQHKTRIMGLVKNKKAKENFVTKWNPKSTSPRFIYVPVPRKTVAIKQLTIDDIDSFEKVKPIKMAPDAKNQPILEETFQQGLQKILEERGEFNDWGGEGDDLFTNRLILNGKRMPVAFGLKGRGTKGKLTPKKLGTQGDQIQRLFRAPADVFMIQYWDQIHESVLEQMRLIAAGWSFFAGKQIYYGVIDGQDTLRIIQAYREYFEV